MDASVCMSMSVYAQKEKQKIQVSKLFPEVFAEAKAEVCRGKSKPRRSVN